MRQDTQLRDAREVLVISHVCPFPTTHGNRSRILALLSWLRERGFRVTFILQPVDVDDGSGITQLRETVDRLIVVPAGRPHRQVMPKVIRTVGARLLMALRRSRDGRRRTGEETPHGDEERTAGATVQRHVDEWCWDATCHEVERVSKAYRPFAVFSEYVLFSQCLQVLHPSSLRVIDTHEVFFRNAERFRIPGLAAPIVCSEASEKAGLSRADVLIAIQGNDAAALRVALPGKRVITVPHTYGNARPRSAVLDRGVVLFVGSSNPFNVHGIREFLHHAWPLVLQQAPFARLQVVGTLPQGDVVDHPRTEYVGCLTDAGLAHRYQTVHVVINPQVAGTGLKVKCVEALSAGCPLVIMPAGADGIEEGAGHAYLLASNWPEFANSVVRLLRDDTCRRQLERGAGVFAERKFSRSAAFAELAAVLDGHVDRWQR